ncbi:MAG: hypothetical protein PHE54_03875 [Bacilli bacterium]|nr:hypothetical protein [Bacilli bacterium]
MRIIVDLDDVICDCGMLYVVNKFLNTNYDINDITRYYVQDLIPEDKMEDFMTFFFDNNMYELVKINDDAKEVLKYLNDTYEVYICSAYVVKDDVSRSGILTLRKHNFLYQNFSFINPNHYIFTSSKDIISADVRIDDKLSNLKGEAKLKLLYTAYHNKELSDKELQKESVVRVNNWLEIKQAIDNYNNDNRM